MGMIDKGTKKSSAKRLSIARPYARAAFRCAVEEKKLGAWSALLSQASAVLKLGAMQDVLKDPRFDKMVACVCLLEVCKNKLFPQGENFFKLLALHRRLLILPEIEVLFQDYKAVRANQVAVQVISAVPLSKAQDLCLTSILEKRLQRKVKLDYLIDDHLLGGLVVRMGDLVIDSSVRGKLGRLRATLVN